MLPMPPSAAAIAIGEALKRVHGPYKNNVNTVVDPLVTYYTGRGESLADIPLDVPSVNKTDHERRWRARLVAAGVADQGDIEDFLLWMDARSAPVGAGGAGAASGLAKVALVPLESVGDRPSAAGMTGLRSKNRWRWARLAMRSRSVSVPRWLFCWCGVATPRRRRRWSGTVNSRR